ncbi:MAG: hypothetical protein IJT94_11735, partial [Oscillibacter sp.]|nr:hypothetical protein [Oscillibacter sp.]
MASTSTQKKTNRAQRRGGSAQTGRNAASGRGTASVRGKKGAAKRGRPPKNAGKPASHDAPPVTEQGAETRPAQRRPRQDNAPFRRKVLGVVMATLALCAFFSAFGSSGSVLNWLDALLKGLFGYGCWLSVPVFAFCACVLLLHPDKPARDRVSAALGLMPALGILGHILLCRQS